MKPRTLSLIAGTGYLVIFFSALFANFMVIEALRQDPMVTIQQHPLMVRSGIMAFMITVVFDVIVAWALYELYKPHALSGLSTLFRMMHAAVMAVALFALIASFSSNTADQILQHVDTFNTIWLIGLFFFGTHLLLLGKIMARPVWITWLLMAAGVMYMVDTTAHFMLQDYDQYASLFLAFVAIPSIVGEMSLAIWLLTKSGKA